MDADIQFGEVEESPPEVRLRPDRNKHYAVVDHQMPADGDLPIFVDLDVMRDMETHAQEDTSVELGGVLLGGQYEDDDGIPFVVVTDSLRAQHYEATKGSFKFTHDTWEQISRERDEFPEDLQMVGWYHTHPDWGVFLSGMDMFICDNFFNRPLDLALVIDPCRGDRGMFQWTGVPEDRIRRTGGFYLMASRFRRYELEVFTCQLEGKLTMPHEARFNPVAGHVGSSQAPVVNISESQNPWQGVAMMAMLTMQFLVLCVIAWKLVGPLPTEETDAEKQAKKIEVIDDKLDSLLEGASLDAELTAQRDVLDSIVSQLKDGQGVVDERVKFEKRLRLAEAAADVELAHREKLEVEKSDLQRSLKSSNGELEYTQKNYEKKKEELTQALEKLKKSETLVANLEKKLGIKKEKSADGDAAEEDNWVIYASIAGAIAILLIVAALGFVFSMKKDEEDEEYHENPEDDEGKTNT